MNSTSLEAYAELRKGGKLQEVERKIVQFLAGCSGPVTRQKIAEYTGITLSSVCGRVNSLVASGALRTAGKRREPMPGGCESPKRELVELVPMEDK